MRIEHDHADASVAAPPRLVALDALRGCTVAAMLLVNDPGDWSHVYAPLEHADWNGCTPTDLIFPVFLFVMGVSVGFGIVPRVERGADLGTLRNAALLRALRLIVLGLAINLLAAWLLPGAHWRIPGVLQRIGLCFAGTALLAIHARPRIWSLAIALLLLGYWAVLIVGGTLAPWDNIVSRVDSAVFGSTAYLIDTATARGHDPEGLLGTLPALATSLLGLRAAQSLRAQRLGAMRFASVIAIAVAWAWSYWLPFNKNLWTPSFAVWTAGWATLTLLAFHHTIDLKQWPAWGRRFGVNAIAAYAGSELMQILLPALGWQEPLYRHLFADWITPQAGPYAASLAFALGSVALWWLIVLAMDKRHIYIRL